MTAAIQIDGPNRPNTDDVLDQLTTAIRPMIEQLTERPEHALRNLHLIGGSYRREPLIHQRADGGLTLAGALIADTGVPRRALARFIFQRDFPRTFRATRHVRRHHRAYTTAAALAAVAGARALR